MDKNVSMDKSKWRVSADGKICVSGYALFYLQTNQKTVNYCRKNMGFGDGVTLKKPRFRR